MYYETKVGKKYLQEAGFACSESVKLHGYKCNLITPIHCHDVKGVFL